MFKVGQRVHNNKEGYFCKIDNIGDDNTTWVTHDDGVDALVLVKDLHETADDMFEALGFGFDNNIYGSDKVEMMFKNGQYIFAYFSGEKLFIDKQLHLAIHQKLVELGWV